MLEKDVYKLKRGNKLRHRYGAYFTVMSIENGEIELLQTGDNLTTNPTSKHKIAKTNVNMLRDMTQTVCLDVYQALQVGDVLVYLPDGRELTIVDIELVTHWRGGTETKRLPYTVTLHTGENLKPQDKILRDIALKV